MPAVDHEVLTWEDFGIAADALASRITADGYRPDLVLAIARGGLALAMRLGYALEVKDLVVVNAELYTGVDERLAEPVVLDPVPDPRLLSGRRVLIVDDVADTGLTLRRVAEICATAAEARVAVIYDKPRSVVLPDWSWRQTDAWIDFPWSAPAPADVSATATSPATAGV